MEIKEKEYFVEFSNRKDILNHKNDIDNYSLTLKHANVYCAIADAALALGIKLGKDAADFCLTCVAECIEKSDFPMKDFYKLS